MSTYPSAPPHWGYRVVTPRSICPLGRWEGRRRWGRGRGGRRGRAQGARARRTRTGTGTGTGTWTMGTGPQRGRALWRARATRRSRRSWCRRLWHRRRPAGDSSRRSQASTPVCKGGMGSNERGGVRAGWLCWSTKGVSSVKHTATRSSLWLGSRSLGASGVGRSCAFNHYPCCTLRRVVAGWRAATGSPAAWRAVTSTCRRRRPAALRCWAGRHPTGAEPGTKTVSG